MRPNLDRVTERLSADPDVVFAYLFGSQATGGAGPASDIDIAVYVRPGSDAFEQRLRLLGLAQTALGADNVDLIVLNDAPLSLAGRVLRTRRVLVDKEPRARHQYESLTARQFFDFHFREHRLLEAMAGRG